MPTSGITWDGTILGENDCWEISKLLIVPQWKSVMHRLGVEECDIIQQPEKTTSTRQQRRKIRTSAYETLLLWIRRNPLTSNVAVLLEAILEEDLNYTAYRLKKWLQTKCRYVHLEGDQLAVAANQASDLLNLPDEILLRILNFLDLKSFILVSLTCLKFEKICRDKSLWQNNTLEKIWILNNAHNTPIWNVCISEHGMLLVTFAGDNLTKIWTSSSKFLYSCNLKQWDLNEKVLHSKFNSTDTKILICYPQEIAIFQITFSDMIFESRVKNYSTVNRGVWLTETSFLSLVRETDNRNSHKMDLFWKNKIVKDNLNCLNAVNASCICVNDASVSDNFMKVLFIKICMGNNDPNCNSNASPCVRNGGSVEKYLVFCKGQYLVFKNIMNEADDSVGGLSIELGGNIKIMEISPNKKKIYLVTELLGNFNIEVIKVGKWRKINRKFTIPQCWNPSQFFSVNNEFVSSGSMTNNTVSIYLWDAHSHALLTEVTSGNEILYGVLNPCNWELLTTDKNSGNINCWKFRVRVVNQRKSGILMQYLH